MKKRIIPIVLVLAAAVGGVLAFRGMGRDDPNRIMVSGNIELEEVNIGFKTAGRLIERTVDEGDMVHKGQIIARLDRDQLTAQQQRETAGVRSSRFQLDQAETSLAWQKATLAADIEQKRADLAAAEARLAELKNGSRPQEKQDARAAVEAAQAEAERAKNDWERAQTLYKNDDISTAQFDEFRNRFDATAATLKSARERESLVLAGPRVEEIDAQAAQVERARAALAMAEANTLEMKRREQELATRRAEIARSKASLELIGTAAFRYHRGLAGGWRGAGEGGRSGRSAGAGHHRGHHRRYRPSLAARLRQRNRPGQGQAGLQGARHHRFVPGQGVRRARHLHRFGSGVHAQADPDPGGAREAGLPDQDRGGQPAARAEIEHAGGRRDSAGAREWPPIIETREPDAPLRRR